MAMANVVEPLPSVLVEDAVRAALKEDLGRAGDITTMSVIAADAQSKAAIVARQPGCISGVDFVKAAFSTLDPSVEVLIVNGDGARVKPGDVVAEITGSSRAILTGERVALNFLGHLSGIASASAKFVDAAQGKVKITCTRKTTPGLRAFEKFAVRCGGGSNHRFGLDDGIMIKDNHIVAAGGIANAIHKARKGCGHMVKIEVEVDTLSQLHEVMAAGADVVLLDNMTPDQLREAVRIIDGKMIAEASGGVTLENIGSIAETGVDVVSIGWLTHSAPCLDLGMDFSS